MKNCIFCAPRQLNLPFCCLSWAYYPEVLTLKVSQRSRVVCWENIQQCLTLWLREGVLTQKHPLGREGYLCCPFKFCEVVSGFSPRLKYLQASLCLGTLSLGQFRLDSMTKKAILASWMVKMNAYRHSCMLEDICMHMYIYICICIYVNFLFI